MKKVLLIITTMLLASFAFAVQNPWDMKLPFKSGTITYKVEGSKKGTKNIYINNYGRTTAEYSDTVMSILGMKKREKEIIITTPDWVFSYTDGDDYATKQANPYKFLIEEFNKLSRSDKKKVAKNAEKSGSSIIAGLNGKIEKNAGEMLGYKYDKVKAMGVTAYIISGTEIPLKTEGGMVGIKVNETAVKIEKNKPSSSKFKLPTSLKIEHSQEADMMAKEQAKSTIQSLIEGHATVQQQPSSEDENGEEGFKMPSMTQEQKDKMKDMMKMFGN